MSEASAPARWRAVAVDDEPPALKRLASLFAASDDVSLVATWSDPAAAVAAIPALRPDVLLVDVQMPGLSGFDVVRALGSSLGDASPLVVFVTAHDEHAIRAFEVGAVDYLLKPVERERFRATMRRVAERLGAAGGAELRRQVEAVLRSMAAPAAPPAPARVAVKVGDRVTLLDPARIDRVEAEGNVIHVIAGAERYAFRETLGGFAERLPAGAFVRVSRSVVVNVARVRYVEPWFNGDYVLVLADGTKVTSGRAYRDGLREALGIR